MSPTQGNSSLVENSPLTKKRQGLRCFLCINEDILVDLRREALVSLCHSRGVKERGTKHRLRQLDVRAQQFPSLCVVV
jgi:hypothetical protein